MKFLECLGWFATLGVIMGFSLLIIFGLLAMKFDPTISGFFGGICFSILCKIDHELSKNNQQ